MIRSAGPAAVLSFVITGMLVMLVMRMLGEMAVARPAVGSFYEYARMAWEDRPTLAALAAFIFEVWCLVRIHDQAARSFAFGASL